MNARTLLGLPLACLILVSCGGGQSAKTRGLSIEELKAKLEGLKRAIDTDCPNCDGSGRITHPDTGATTPCTECKDTRKAQITVGAPIEEFYEAIGEPIKIERKPGDLIWEYWYYRCSEGMVRVHAYEAERRGDVVRVETGTVEPARPPSS